MKSFERLFVSATCTRMRILTCVAAVLLLALFVHLAFVLLLTRAFGPYTAILIDSVASGLICSVLMFLIVELAIQRRNHVRRELRNVAALNHEIRNALENLTHAAWDERHEHAEIISDAVNRISTTLHALSPSIPPPPKPWWSELAERDEDQAGWTKAGGDRGAT